MDMGPLKLINIFQAGLPMNPSRHGERFTLFSIVSENNDDGKKRL